MRVVVQRVKSASVMVNKTVVGQISQGLVILVGFKDGDNEDTISYMVKKILSLRIFDDQNKVMNLNIKDVNGTVLSVSQFTLYADTKKGNRPSYIKALNSDDAEKLYQKFNDELRHEISVETGRFGEDMQVTLTNDGPVTILLER